MAQNINIGPIVKIVKTDEEWKKLLAPEAYQVLRHEDTERPFTDNMHDSKRDGVYSCAGCNLPLFSSEHKFDSGTGWPSFTRPLEPANVVETNGHSFDMFGVEVRSGHGDSHLGHVFADGPAPTGLRYCINSAALRFVPEAQLEKLGYGRYAALFKQPGGTR